MTDLKKLENLASLLARQDLQSVQKLAVEGLQFDPTNKPVNKANWTDEEKANVEESRIIAEKNNFFIYYIRIKTDSTKLWKSTATKIIRENLGYCLVCTHNPSSGYRWIFSSLSKVYSQSFSEARHVSIEIKPNLVPSSNFVEFLNKIKVGENSTPQFIAAGVSEAFDFFAVEIRDALTFNVFKALKILSEGIIDKSNNLSLSQKTLDDVRSPIFILLYRLIFILYAEDRGIFPDEKDKIYHETFSLKWIKKEWILKSGDEKLADYQVQKRLWNLFKLIEHGSSVFPEQEKEKFSMRSYYGRIFDSAKNWELESWKIPNSYLIKTLELLTQTTDKNRNSYFLDYTALDTKHIGSIYERLLEYHLCVDDGKISECPDVEDRRASGSYYTPKYIVEYVVQNSIQPLIEDIIEKNHDTTKQIDKILSLKILDPAMGSGDFLVGAIEYIAKQLCKIKFEDNYSEQDYINLKRDVVRRCIYGVDVNPLAVDLASLSLWLETLSSDKPLSFLQSHLKCGNSLIGSEIESIFGEYDVHSKTTQATLVDYLEQENEETRNNFKKNIQNFIMFENLEDDSLSKVKVKIEEYDKMQSKGTIYKKLQFLLNCRTAEFFGAKLPILLREISTKIAKNSEFASDKRFKKIHALSEENRFFHWGLEFPQIYYNENGEKKSSSGFDVIIGNPPYIRIQSVKVNAPLQLDYFKNFFHPSGNYDISILFLEKSFDLLNQNGVDGFITTSKFFQAVYGKQIRSIICKKKAIKEIIDFGDQQVFRGVSTYTALLFLTKSENEKFKYVRIKKLLEKIEQFNTNKIEDDSLVSHSYDISKLSDKPWMFVSGQEDSIIEKIKNCKTLDQISEKIFIGISTSSDPVFILKFIKEKNGLVTAFSKSLNNEVILEKQLLRKLVKGNEMGRWYIPRPDGVVIFPYFIKNKDPSLIEEKVLKRDFPYVYQYFKNNKKTLENRERGRWKGTTNWYAYGRPQNLIQFDQAKLLVQVLANKPTFSIDRDNNYYFVGGGNAGGYGISLPKNSEISLEFLCAILNSSLTHWLVKKRSSPFQRGFCSFAKRFIEDLPIISSKSNQTLVKKIEKKVRSLSKNRTEDSEAEIDSIISKMYGLDENEIKIIFDGLSTPENHRSKVLEYFRKL